MQLLHKLNHPNILQTKEGFYDSKNDLTQIIEFCGFGSLQHQFDIKMNEPEELSTSQKNSLKGSSAVSSSISVGGKSLQVSEK